MERFRGALILNMIEIETWLDIYGLVWTLSLLALPLPECVGGKPMCVVSQKKGNARVSMNNPQKEDLCYIQQISSGKGKKIEET